MIILGTETSCDETALSIIDIHESANGEKELKILANQVLSQIELHKQYGGVFPMMAKREHSRNLVPLLKIVLTEANFLKTSEKQHPYKLEFVRMLLEREPEMFDRFVKFIPTVEKPPVDLIAVTSGPGLEPCLWTGINFAKALSLVWDIPVVPVNHMEGHVLISLLKRNEEIPNSSNYLISKPDFPALALLISGGHTELVLMKDWLQYEIIGRTRDDAVGEAFDKVARILGLPYPGGPQISALAEIARNNADLTPTDAEKITLPRPMIKSDNLDFSFSGLKTAVLYLVKKLEKETDARNAPVSDIPRSFSVSPRLQSIIAREFEDAVTEVIVSKTRKAIEEYGIRTLVVGGGVIANTHIRQTLEALARKSGTSLFIPEPRLATDNALMIAIAGLMRYNPKKASNKGDFAKLAAEGNLNMYNSQYLGITL